MAFTEVLAAPSQLRRYLDVRVEKAPAVGKEMDVIIRALEAETIDEAAFKKAAHVVRPIEPPTLTPCISPSRPIVTLSPAAGIHWELRSASITDANGNNLATVNVNQQLNGSRWNTLGTWSFPAGWNKVQLSRWTTSGSYVVADAIQVR